MQKIFNVASFIVNGIIEKISFLPNREGCVVSVVEYKRGFKKKNGEIVDDKYLHWKCIFRQSQVDFINSHFSKSMYVEVKGDIVPYSIENGRLVEPSYSVLGQTINMASYPPRSIELEYKNIKDSQLHSVGKPNLDGYMEDDF